MEEKMILLNKNRIVLNPEINEDDVYLFKSTLLPICDELSLLRIHNNKILCSTISGTA